MSDRVTEITDADFEATAGAPGAALVDFYATWCSHCKAFRPDFDSAAEACELPVRFYAADVDQTNDMAKELKIRSIPAVVLFKDGEKIDSHVGALKPDDLAAWIAGLV